MPVPKSYLTLRMLNYVRESGTWSAEQLLWLEKKVKRELAKKRRKQASRRRLDKAGRTARRSTPEGRCISVARKFTGPKGTKAPESIETIGSTRHITNLGVSLRPDEAVKGKVRKKALTRQERSDAVIRCDDAEQMTKYLQEERRILQAVPPRKKRKSPRTRAQMLADRRAKTKADFAKHGMHYPEIE